MSSSSEENDVESESLEGNDDLDAFRHKLRPEMLNLMNEFADAEMFLIDGDSLLMELSLDKNLDWKYSGQFLHLVYLFERYLHLFVRKDGVFQIVFFKDFENVWKSQPALHLARNVIIQHLLTNVSDYKLLCDFESPWDLEFIEYVKNFAPSFMLLSDGEILSEWKDQRLIPDASNASKIFILHFLKILSLEINIAFTGGIQFATSSLNGFHLTSSPTFWRWGLPKQMLVDSLDLFSAGCHTRAGLTQVIETILIKLNNTSPRFAAECQDHDGIIDCRLILHVVTVTAYFKSSFAADNDQNFQLDLVRIFLLHGVLLTQLPLKYRAFSPDDCDGLLKKSTVRNQFEKSLRNFQVIMAEVLDIFIEALKDDVSCSMSGICDAWDGRLFYQIFALLIASKRNGNEVSLSKSSQRKFESLVQVASSLLDGEVKLEAFPILQYLGCNEDQSWDQCTSNSKDGNPISRNRKAEILKKYCGHSLKKEKSQSEIVESKDGLIQMECSLLNDYAGTILDNTSVERLDLNDPGVAAVVVSGNDFDETYHWHSGKPLDDEYDRTKDDSVSETKNKLAFMREKHKYARYMQRYGESLQGEVNFKPIIVEKTMKEKKEKSKAVSTKKSLAMQEENKEKNENKKAQKDEESWLIEKKRIQLLENEGRYDAAVDHLKRFLERVTEGKTRFDVLLMRARIYWKKWKESCTKKKDDQDESQDEIDAEILFLTIQEVIENYQEGLAKKDKHALAQYLSDLGFDDIVSNTNLTTKSLEPHDECSLKISSSRFQLRNLGEKLKRETRKDKDSRVDHFIPETWQRELLDAVDNKQSALIVAPTSSGKTFASYYCMEQVLKEDNDGVVVYVSPTKALVNQVVATCHARYNKTMPPGKSVYGVFTRDYRHDALTCQILVTVPQCLEILLLSPARQDWVEKIRYVVFDEVHCIGLENNSEVWEHLLLLIRSPFLALSATIRNPHDLHEWLQSSENAKHERDKRTNTLRPNSPKSYEVALVTYNERYNDLERFNYLPTSKYHPKPVIQHIHPCSVLTTRQLEQSNTFPPHVSLSPRETLHFYDALQQVFPEKETLQNLSPELYFQNETFLTRQNAKAYDSALKEEFMTYVQDNDKRVDTVIKRLRPGPSLSSLPKSDQIRFLLDQVIPLLEELKANDGLPVIFFSFDRSLCERFVRKVLNYLEEKEEHLGGDGKSQEKLERSKAKEEKRNRDTDEVEVMRKTQSAGHSDSHRKRKTTAEASCFLVDDPPPQSCSFAGVGVLDAADGEVIVERLERKEVKSSVDPTFKEGLRRGVSYHHAGMSSRLRSAVEMLFRKKFVRVVFATGTLALGIHMPCKTVVLANDSVYLNTLQYHQISGRAGRRGYDLIGKVIFFGIPKAKIQRLMTVNLPRIIGNFPLNVSLVLRLLLLVNKVKDREIARNQVLTLLQNPLICKNQPELDLQLKHHFLFSVELLVRQGLVDAKGNPQGLAGLATHLHYHEPSNFVLVSFLQDGLLHDLCKCARSRGREYSKDSLKFLVVLLSHLFARRPLHSMLLRRPRSTSKVVLEDLPGKFKEGLQKYNKKVHGVFDLYLRTVAAYTYETLGEDVILPLSSTKLISSQNFPVNSPVVTLEDQLQAVALPYKACSAFAALSGNTDNRLYSSTELISNIRYQVYTDVKVIPTLDTGYKLNAYAYDFFNHGNSKALTQENGIKAGEVFQLLKDFMLVLKSIAVSLAELAPDDGDDVTRAFEQLADDFESKFNEAFNIKKW